ncbi:MAG: hypothetical protein LBP61_07900 [Desulfovibrio sp.]|nr:hypothetical protein [Desulfovibrio sp.]
MKKSRCPRAIPEKRRLAGKGFLFSAVLLALSAAFFLFWAGAVPALAKAPKACARAVVPPDAARPVAAKEIASAAKPDRPARALPRIPLKGSAAGLKKFSPRVFLLEGAPSPAAAPRRPPSLEKVFAVTPRDSGSAERKSSSPDDAGRVELSGSVPSHPESRMDVERSPLPGGRHTLSSEESGTTPEMSMSVKMSPKASARFALNPQDESSPLYSPHAKGNDFAATGVYLDLEMREGVQLQLGGEVRSAGSDSLGSADNDAAGASVGLRWSF